MAETATMLAALAREGSLQVFAAVVRCIGHGEITKRR